MTRRQIIGITLCARPACGQEFEPRRKNQKYCDADCQSKMYYESHRNLSIERARHSYQRAYPERLMRRMCECGSGLLKFQRNNITQCERCHALPTPGEFLELRTNYG